MASGSLFAAQLSKTDGLALTQIGGAYSSINAGQTGAAVYSSNGSTVTGRSLTITDGGFITYAPVYAASSGKIFLDNTNISGTKGLYANQIGSLITMTGGSIVASGSGSTAIEAHDGGAVTLNNVDVTSTGSNWGALVWGNNASLTINGGTLTVTGNAVGMQIQSGGNIHADGITIASDGQAVRNLQGNLELKNFTIGTVADNSFGLDANIGSTSTLSNGTIRTKGANASGIWASSSTAGPTTVTGDKLHIITEGLNAQGVFANTATSITLTNSTVSTVRAYGLYTQNGGTVSLTNGSITTTGAGGNGVFAVSAGSKITLDKVDITTAANSAVGLYSYSSALVTANNSSIKTSGDSSYGVFTGSGATTNLMNTNITTTGANAYALVFYGATALNTISVTGGAIESKNDAAVVANGGTNALQLKNTSVSGSGLLAVADTNTNSGTFGSKLSISADNSSLNGGVRVDSISSLNLNLQNNSVWTLTPGLDGITSSAVSTLAIADGKITFAAPTSGDFQTLTVGSGIPGTTVVYNASNATLQMNTRFNEGGALSKQQTDRLLVNGNVSGTTMVKIVGTAGSPGGGTSLGSNLASEGISLIQVSGTSTTSAFQLLGGYATLGGMPYQYRLYAYGPGAANGEAEASQRLVTGSNPYWDYRLQSVYVTPGTPGSDPTPTRSVAPQVPAYILAPTALFQAGLQDISNLHSRLGEIRDDRAMGRNGGTGEFFIRGYGGKYSYTSNRNAYAYGYDANVDYTAIQMGGNLYAFENASGVTRFGLAGTIGSLSFDPKRVDNASSGDLNTWSVAGYATYLHNSGWYVDGIVSFGAFDGHVSTSLRGRTADLTGNSFSASIETGYPIALGNGLVLEPQAQLVYQRLMFDRKNDVDNFVVSLGNQDQLTGRLGARLSRSFTATDKLVTIYAKANVLHGIVSGGEIFLGDTFRLGRYGTAVEGGIGINATLSKNLSLYADAAYQHKVGKSGVSGISVNGGLRYNF